MKSMRRKDRKGTVLKDGEYQRANGTYEYRWTNKNGERKSVYAKSLSELRLKKEGIESKKKNVAPKDVRKLTVNDVFTMWFDNKITLKENTRVHYKYMYTRYVEKDLGTYKISTLSPTDVRNFYKRLSTTKQVKRSLTGSTIDNIHTVLSQVLEFAVEENYISSNPTRGTMRDIKRSNRGQNRKAKALTVKEQVALMNYLNNEEKYEHWMPLITVMMETGLRACEVTGLRWNDIDLEKGTIDINHSLVYYKKESGKCGLSASSTKSPSADRYIYMTSNVKKAFMKQKEFSLTCRDVVDGYTNFIFLTRFGDAQNRNNINKALGRIVRDHNDMMLAKYEEGTIKKEELVLIPAISCHDLRHTCATRLCESQRNLKFMQDMLGHSDVKLTLNIYTEAQDELKKNEINEYDKYLKNNSLK